ncbi:uncharacterized protein LOC142985238 isoform X2 [Anticarsia gemmatalis]
MLLLKRLIRNKQNTVMTNTQIIEILSQEFDIDVKSCHELEVDIYIKIIKKYLKDWPQWEELERISTKLCTANDFDAIMKVLDHKYKHLKEYLGVMLEATKPLAKKAVADLSLDHNKEKNLDSSDVALEVYCTRDQLNHLIFRRPRTDLNNSIFNVERVEPTRISLNTLSFQAIVNFWWTKITIDTANVLIHRELLYKYKHALINQVPEQSKPVAELHSAAISICRGRKTSEYAKKNITQYFTRILSTCNDENVKQILEIIFQIIRTDIKTFPDQLKVPATYMRHASRYKYVRHLFVENDRNDDAKYDLQLEEIVTPLVQVFVGRLGKYEKLGPIKDWLSIECCLCKMKFQGSTELVSVLQAHFTECHQHEADWQCVNCKKMFGIDYLSTHRWFHNCNSTAAE